MSTPEQVVNDFIAMWAEPGGFSASFPKYFTETTVYENVGMSKTTGVAEAVGFAEQFTATTPGATLRVETLRSAVNGNVVMNERVDHIVDGAGTVQLSIAVMGVFEVDGERITGWRDYFDTAKVFANAAEHDKAT